MDHESQIIGCVLGTAVGDAIGLPYEGVSRKRLPRLLGPPTRHRFLLGRGMISDDTEHTCLVAQSLIASKFDLDCFKREFASRLRWWFASLPAGIGRTTLRACIRLWIGVPAESSGVFSAGNGPAMRSAIFGAAFDDRDAMIEFVHVSTRITHSDPKAKFGAIAIALATFIARQESNLDGTTYVNNLADVIGSEGDELIEILRNVVNSVSNGESTLDYALGNGHERGVTGYTYHTVPIVIHAWLSNSRDYRSAVTSAIECGGDADTTAAIVGGIVGATVGEQGIPAEWVSNICDWPRSVKWMRRISNQLYDTKKSDTRSTPISANFVAVLLRNLLFLAVVLIHGFRRLFPPY